MMYVQFFSCLFIGLIIVYSLLSKDSLAGSSFKGFNLKSLNKALAKKVRFKTDTEKEVKNKLEKAGIGATPKEYKAEGLILTIPFLVIALVLAVARNIVPGIILIVVSFGLYKNHMKKLDEKADKYDREIRGDISELMKYLSFSLRSNRDLTAIIGSYLPVARPALKKELNKLLLDLKNGNADEALINFDTRINLVYLSMYLSALRAMLIGEIQADTLDSVALNAEIFEHELDKKKAAKIPGKISKASAITAFSGLIFLVVLLTLVGIIGIKILLG